MRYKPPIKCILRLRAVVLIRQLAVNELTAAGTCIYLLLHQYQQLHIAHVFFQAGVPQLGGDFPRLHYSRQCL